VATLFRCRRRGWRWLRVERKCDEDRSRFCERGATRGAQRPARRLRAATAKIQLELELSLLARDASMDEPLVGEFARAAQMLRDLGEDYTTIRTFARHVPIERKAPCGILSRHGRGREHPQ
jgi:hypothetical protein